MDPPGWTPGPAGLAAELAACKAAVERAWALVRAWQADGHLVAAGELADALTGNGPADGAH